MLLDQRGHALSLITHLRHHRNFISYLISPQQSKIEPDLSPTSHMAYSKQRNQLNELPTLASSSSARSRTPSAIICGRHPLFHHGSSDRSPKSAQMLSILSNEPTLLPHTSNPQHQTPNTDPNSTPRRKARTKHHTATYATTKIALSPQQPKHTFSAPVNTATSTRCTSADTTRPFK